MDRRPDPTDELYDFAREAYACADYDQAVYFLRKASSLAPMRQDIRQFLAEILSKSGDGAGEKGPSDLDSRMTDFRPVPVEIVQRPVPREQLAAVETRASTVSGFFHQPLRKLMERLPVRPLFSAAEEDESLPHVETARIEHISVAPAAVLNACPASEPQPIDSPFDSLPSDETVQMSLPRPSSRSDFGSSRRREPDSFSEADGSDFSIPDWAKESDEEDESDSAIPAKHEKPRRTRSRVATPVPVPVADAPGEELSAGTATAADWLASLPVPSRRMIAFGSAYAAVAIFIAVACTQCYSRFFRNGNSSAQSPALVSHPETASRPRVQTAISTSAAFVAQPTDAASIEREIRDLVAKGELNAAADLLTIHASQLGEKVNTLRTDMAKIFDRKGTEHLTQSRFAPAVEDYSKAFGFDSSNSNYAVHLGNAYYHAAKRTKGPAAQEQLQKALEVLQRAVELDSQSVEAYHRLATVHEQLGKRAEAQSAWNKALAVLNRSLQTNGRSIETYQRIAMVSECLGRKSEQRNACKAILKLAKPDSQAAISAEKELKSLGKSN